MVNSEYPGVIQEEIKLGDRIVSEMGGYSIQSMPDFEIKEAGGFVTMFPPNGDKQSGPGFVISGENFDQQINLKTAIEGIIKNASNHQFDRPLPISVGGSDGLSANYFFTYHALDGVILENPGANEGERIRGQSVVVVLEDHKLIKINCYAPEKLYSSIGPVFNSVLKSIRF